jgi:hypothetical protein
MVVCSLLLRLIISTGTAVRCAASGKYNVVPSEQISMTCHPSMKTDCQSGGDTRYVFDFANQGYLPSVSASPYTQKIDADDQGFCASTSPAPEVLRRLKYPSISYKTSLLDPSIQGTPDRYETAVRRMGEVAMMKEIYDNGPAGIDIRWEGFAETYPANKGVCNGIQTDRNCSVALDNAKRGPDGKSCVFAFGDLNHAVAVVGWGVDPVGCPDIPGPIKYWIIQNSHGAGTGDCEGAGCGFYKFERGVNALGLETSGVYGTTVDLDNMACKDKADPATWCANGGSFTADCGCFCPPEYGFSGSTCMTCELTCQSGAKAIVQPADPMRGVPAACKCPCPKGQWSPTNLAGKGIDDCAIAVGFWVGDATIINPDALQWDMPVQVQAAPATFKWLFSKQKDKPNAGYAPFINKGDFLVAVPTGTKPWTPETNWDGNSGKADICGPKETSNNQLVGCSPYGGWGLTEDSAKGTLTIPKEGIYDVYYVKYQGVSEFGVDKGFGKNFAKLPQTLVVGAMPGRRGLLSAAIRTTMLRNRQLQLQRQLAANAKKRTEVQAKQAITDAAAAKAAAAQEKKDAPRTAYVPLVIKGLLLSEFSIVEETSLKSVLAQYAGPVCTPERKKITNTNTNKYDKCSVREAWVQRIGTNVTTPLADGSGIVVFSKVTTNETAAVPTAAAALSSAIQGGSLLNALKKSGGAFTRRAAALSIAPYTASVSDKLGSLPPSLPPAASPAATVKIAAAATATPSLAAATVAAIIAARALNR